MSKLVLGILAVLTVLQAFLVRIAVVAFALFVILLFGHGVYEQLNEMLSQYRTKRAIRRRQAVAA